MFSCRWSIFDKLHEVAAQSSHLDLQFFQWFEVVHHLGQSFQKHRWEKDIKKVLY